MPIGLSTDFKDADRGQNILLFGVPYGSKFAYFLGQVQ
jgi:hypothetical protein